MSNPGLGHLPGWIQAPTGNVEREWIEPASAASASIDETVHTPARKPKASAKPKAASAKSAVKKKRAPAKKLTAEEREKAKLTSEGKAVFQHILRHRYPDGFWPMGQRPNESNESTVVFHDSLQLLRSLRMFGKDGKKNTNLVTWRDLVQAYKNTVEFEFKNHRNVRTFVMCKDKSGMVWLAKSIEQAARRKNIQPIDHEVDMNMTLDGKIPDFWDDALGHHALVARIIRFIFTTLATVPEMRFGLPPGRSVIVDGHCLEPEDLPADAMWRDTADTRVAMRPSSDVLKRTPVRFDPGQKVSLCWDLVNSIGEADFSIPYLMRAIAPHEKVTVYTVDTDSIGVFLRYKEAYPDSGRVLLRLWPQLTCSAFYDRPKYPDQRWCHIDRLLEIIEQDPALFSLKRPIGSLAAVYNAAGSDYTAVLSGVPRYHFINSFFAFAQEIGDLVTDDWMLIEMAYQRLVQYACYSAYHKASQGIAEGVAKRKGETFIAKPVTHEVNLSKGAGRMPADLDMRALHVGLCMEALKCVGHRDLREPSLDRYGYCRIDRAYPVSKDNLRRCDHTHPRDDFSELEVDPNRADRPHIISLKLGYEELTAWRNFQIDIKRFGDQDFRQLVAESIASQVRATLEHLYLDYMTIPEEERMCELD